METKFHGRLCVKIEEIEHQVKCLLTFCVGIGRMSNIKVIGNIRKKANI